MHDEREQTSDCPAAGRDLGGLIGSWGAWCKYSYRGTCYEKSEIDMVMHRQLGAEVERFSVLKMRGMGRTGKRPETMDDAKASSQM